MNTPLIQEVIGKAFLLRDTSLVRLDEYMTKCQEEGKVFGILVIDLDKSSEAKNIGLEFKLDLVVQVNAKLQQLLHESEVFFPMGNDESVIACGDISEDEMLRRRADEIRSAIEQSEFTVCLGEESASFNVTICAGRSFYPDDGQSAPDLYQSGLNGVYLAKRQGRNCSVNAGHNKTAILSVATTPYIAEGIRQLGRDLGRDVDGMATEAFDGLLRRYHRI